MAGLRYLGRLNLSFWASFFSKGAWLISISIHLLPYKKIRRNTQKAFPPYLISALYLSRHLRLFNYRM